ncbi:hypothetical protein Tco_1204739 [Tanacetum coccineum]
MTIVLISVVNGREATSSLIVSYLLLRLQLLRLDSSMVRIQDIRFEDFQEEVKWSYGINTASLLHDIYVNTASINMDNISDGHA